jgi:polysaccharide biosynthesis protein PslH
MKILLVCNKFPYPPRDGGSLASYNMIRGLASSGNLVDLLSINTSKHYSPEGARKLNIDGLNRVRDVFVDTSLSFTGLLNNLLFSSLPYNAERFISREFSGALAEMLQTENYDLVQFEGLYLAPYLSTVRENSNARIVYRAHNIEHLIWESYSKNAGNLFKKLYLGRLKERIRNFERDFLNRYDLLVAITGEDLMQLNLMGNTKPAIVSPFGMYPGEIVTRNNDIRDDVCLQYIGALDWLPNIEALEWFIDRVWVKIRIKYPGLKFKVAGRNPGQGLVNKMKRQDIEFLGEVDNSTEFLSENGIFIVPLFSGSGIRVKIIEALFMKKAIIATPFAVSGIPVEDGTNILIAGNEDEFIRHIGSIMENRQIMTDLGARAGELSASCFNNVVIAGELTAFYKKYAV